MNSGHVLLLLLARIAHVVQCLETAEKLPFQLVVVLFLSLQLTLLFLYFLKQRSTQTPLIRNACLHLDHDTSEMVLNPKLLIDRTKSLLDAQ